MRQKWKEEQKQDHNEWCFASLPEVENNMAKTNYPKDKLVFVKPTHFIPLLKN